MKLFFSFLTVLFLTVSGFAGTSLSTDQNFKGFVQIAKGRQLYVDWIKAKNNQPTMLLLNGLTYDTTDWDKFVASFSKYGYGIFRYDPKGMGKTLERDGAVTDIIRLEDQARDLDLLTKAVGFTGKLNLVGLSYGGGLAIAFAKNYSARINKSILISPFVGPLAQQDQLIQSEIAMTRINFPFNPATDEELYAYFLRNIVYFVDPVSEPSILRSPLKPEAVFQMTQGIRKYNVAAAAKLLPAHAVHLMVAGGDQYIPQPMLNSFWDGLTVDQRASRIYVNYSEHKIPEEEPDIVANWINKIMQDGPGMSEGLSYEVSILDGKITLQH